jgi:lysozyme family protein
MKPDLDFVLAEVARIEGGHANLPGDTGGETFYGISQYARLEYERRVGHWPPTQAGAKQFYSFWWVDLQLNKMHTSTRVAVQLMLFRIHTHQLTTTRALQVALNVSGSPTAIDGRMGPATLRAVAYADEARLYDTLRAAAGMFYTTRDLWPKYGVSWVRNRLRMVAA